MDLSKIFDHVRKDENDCWLWLNGYNSAGYGVVWDGKKQQLAHRISYVQCIGSLNKNLYVLHRCDNRRCINPAHLFVGSHKQNMEDMQNKSRHFNSTKDVCKHGHLLNEENTYVLPDGHRQCKQCKKTIYQ